MSPSKGRRSRGYHHGDLREALVNAALSLIAEKGPGGLTMSDAARATGVSPAAPYRHFDDREALIAEIARRGFERLDSALFAAWDEGRPDPMSAFARTGRAYLAFARAQPAYYAAMFESGLPADTSRELTVAADKAFGVLSTAAEILCARIPKADRPPVGMVSRHIWALSHGIASLYARGDDGRRALPMPPEDLLEAAVLIYLRGLGLQT